ncbi:MAG: hypothetical protein Q4C93_03510 [Clostridia bacterium]|nr:hypothetical protein [Clostridia bacterium]
MKLPSSSILPSRITTIPPKRRRSDSSKECVTTMRAMPLRPLSHAFSHSVKT